MYEQQNEIEKAIQITSLSQRIVPYMSKKTGLPTTFTVYQVVGNDGITYETSDAEWYTQHKIGDQVTIKYTIRITTGKNGQVYTNYNIVTKKQYSQIMLDAMKKIFDQVKSSELNIIARINLLGGIKTEKPIETIHIEEEKVEEESTEVKDDGIPF
jgi:hypothetical protein